MAASHSSAALKQLLHAALAGDAAGLTDGQLLDSYLATRDEAAVAALVRRHGPMVWGVCRRLLHDHHDAEDAFQATFLVLARRATSITPRDMVANFLHGVACRTALKARAMAAQRRTRELPVPDVPEQATAERDLWHDLRPVLDQELGRLPEMYRAVVVLCDLEGRTRSEAAQHLGCPEGTVASRLATSRQMLAKRLARHAPGVTATSLAAALAAPTASAAVPPLVLSSTIHAAAAGATTARIAALTEGVLNAMSSSKLTVAAALLVSTLLLGAGAVALAGRAPVVPPAPAVRAADPEPKKDPKKGKTVVLIGRGVKAVDARKRTIKLAPNLNLMKIALAKRNPAALPDETFEVAQGAVIEIDGAAAKLADLRLGAYVYARVSEDRKTLWELRTAPLFTGGRVTAVDAANSSITIDVERTGRTYTLTVAKGATVERGGKAANLAAVQAGDDVWAELSAARKHTALALREGKPRGVVVGDVKAVDPEKNTLTVTNEEGDRALPLAKGATVVIAGKAGRLADLKPGAAIDARMTEDGKSVESITARRP